MRNKENIYNLTNMIAAVFMIMALLWLTVSLPFVFSAHEQLAANIKGNPVDQSQPADADDTCNPFANTTEEKAPSGGTISLSEEYIHHNDQLFSFAELSMSHNRIHAVSEYTAYHGEILCPPPNCYLS